jgi:hypothetical protein
MLKKLISILVFTSLAFGVDVSKNNGLCFDPYNHDYGQFGIDRKEIVLHNGKMQLDRDISMRLITYAAEDNKVLVLTRAADIYAVFYVDCVNGKPQTEYVEDVGLPYFIRLPTKDVENALLPYSSAVDNPKYPAKLGFYKNGFYVTALVIGRVTRDSNYYCYYRTVYCPYDVYKTDKLFKDKDLPTRVCNALGKQLVK